MRQILTAAAFYYVIYRASVNIFYQIRERLTSLIKICICQQKINSYYLVPKTFDAYFKLEA